MNCKHLIGGILFILITSMAFGESASSDNLISFDLYAPDVLYPVAIASPHSSARPVVDKTCCRLLDFMYNELRSRKMMTDIRWKQRFQNYEKALQQLTEFMEVDQLNKFERQGLIQCFEYTFELGWKTMKDYLSYQGLEVTAPRETIQKAFQNRVIEHGHEWIDALEKRNLMAHTYSEENVEKAEYLIRNTYYELLVSLKNTLDVSR
jgi:nucleotidyltransferase substrate binding protein (TIGR01987 family)